MKDKSLIVIVGPTAIGKTGIAIELAQQLNTEIISSDSRQIYREMKIGTARPSDKQLSMVKHYFIASHSITEYYNASMFEIAALNVINEIFNTNNNAIMVGGSGLYVNAVCHGIDDLPTIEPEVRKNITERLNNEGIESLRTELLRIDPEYCKTADIQNPKRILKALEIYYMTGMPYSMLLTKTKKERNFNIIKIGLNIERQLLYDQINKRVDSMIANGLLKEAEHLLPFKNLNALNTVGYKELFSCFNNEISLTKATELIKQNTRNYAKRQLTWFSRDNEIEWFNPADKIEILNFIKDKTQ